MGIAFKDGKPNQGGGRVRPGLGLGVDELTVRDDDVWGRQSAPPLAERLWQVVGGLAAGKTMVWDRKLDIRFPRPIRWMCAKLDGETIHVGPEAIPSGGVSYGHRFIAGTIEIPEAAAYETVLREAQVEPDSAERRRLIVEGLDATGEWRDPARVLDEVVYLVESPLVLEGSFDERFLDLPERVIVTAMQSHQRYFPLGGVHFAFVANGGDHDVVLDRERARAGGAPRRCEVLVRAGRPGGHRGHGGAARLDHVPRASGHVRRQGHQAPWLCDLLGGGEASGEAARLAKADQASTMVHEFPEASKGSSEGSTPASLECRKAWRQPSRSTISRTRQAGRCRRRQPGECFPRPTRSTTSQSPSRSGSARRFGATPMDCAGRRSGLSRLAVDGELEIDLAGLVARDSSS